MPEPPASTVTGAPFRLPFGIVLIAILRVMDATTIAAIAVGWRPFPLHSLPAPLSDPAVVLIAGLAWAGAALLGVVGLLLLRRWGWVLTMVMVGVGLAFTILRWAAGTPDYLEMLLLVVTAFYLNQRSARSIADRRRPDGEPARQGGPASAAG